MHQIQLTNEEATRLQRSVNGEGGHQNFLRKLQGQLNGNTLNVSDDDLQRALRYFVGQGGFQDRIEPVAEAAQKLNP